MSNYFFYSRSQARILIYRTWCIGASWKIMLTECPVRVCICFMSGLFSEFFWIHFWLQGLHLMVFQILGPIANLGRDLTAFIC